MDVPGPERRLAAVLAADMVGYSRLMEVDETGTLARLKTHRIELIDPAIAKNRGRIIKTTGDGMLVEFHSVVDAVLCAAEVQRRMARAQRRRRAGAVDTVPHRHQSRRHHRRGRRHLRRRRQCRGAARGAGRARRHLHLGRGARSGRRPAGRRRASRISATRASRTSRVRSASSASGSSRTPSRAPSGARRRGRHGDRQEAARSPCCRSSI